MKESDRVSNERVNERIADSVITANLYMSEIGFAKTHLMESETAILFEVTVSPFSISKTISKSFWPIARMNLLSDEMSKDKILPASPCNSRTNFRCVKSHTQIGASRFGLDMDPI